jgi:hypothetical protein
MGVKEKGELVLDQGPEVIKIYFMSGREEKKDSGCGDKRK